MNESAAGVHSPPMAFFKVGRKEVKPQAADASKNHLLAPTPRSPPSPQCCPVRSTLCSAGKGGESVTRAGLGWRLFQRFAPRGRFWGWMPAALPTGIQTGLLYGRKRKKRFLPSYFNAAARFSCRALSVSHTAGSTEISTIAMITSEKFFSTNGSPPKKYPPHRNRLTHSVPPTML